jgi:hypothetical protein
MTITDFVLRELTQSPKTLEQLRRVPELKWVPLRDLRDILSYCVEHGHVRMELDGNDHEPIFEALSSDRVVRR